jgi:hypothetical protein
MYVVGTTISNGADTICFCARGINGVYRTVYNIHTINDNPTHYQLVVVVMFRISEIERTKNYQ